ncbi:MAG: hypothetical protein JEZ03_07580 [Bacteroidales bacterium]|nr:hypothetical protein [Bacteroidales bacterium]
MNRILLLSIMLLFSYGISAQIAPNRFFIGGSTNLNLDFITSDYGTNSDVKGYEIDFSPEIGYMLNQHLAVGIRGDIFLEKEEANLSLQEWNEIGMGTFARVFFKIIRFNPYADLTVGYVRSTRLMEHDNIIDTPDNISDFTIENVSNGFSFSPGLGFVFELTQSIGIDFRFSYYYKQYKLTDDSYGANFDDNTPEIRKGLDTKFGLIIQL